MASTLTWHPSSMISYCSRLAASNDSSTPEEVLSVRAWSTEPVSPLRTATEFLQWYVTFWWARFDSSRRNVS